MIKLPVDFIDHMAITYECPQCGHSQKQTFILRKTGIPMKFACGKCSFENEITIKDDNKLLVELDLVKQNLATCELNFDNLSRFNDERRAQITKYAKEIAEAKTEVARLLEDCPKMHETDRAQLERAETEIERLKKWMPEPSKVAKEMVRENNHLKGEIKALQSSIDRIRMESSENLQQRNHYKAEVERLKATIKHDIDKIEAAYMCADTLIGVNDQLTEAKAEISSLKTAAKLDQEEYAELHKEFEQANERIANVEKMLLAAREISMEHDSPGTLWISKAIIAIKKWKASK